MPNSASPPRAEQILVRGVNWLGDAIMTTPALLRLREARPADHITLLTPEKLADLWLHHPALDQVVTFRKSENLFRVARRLRRARFTCALVFPNSTRSALETFLAGIPRRVGYGGRGRRFLLTTVTARSPHFLPMRKRSVKEIRQRVQGGPVAAPATVPAAAHQMQHYLDLAAMLGASPEALPPRLCLTNDELQQVAAQFQLQTDPRQSRLILALNPGAEYGPAKRWPLDRFAAAAVDLHRRTGCRWVILGGSHDQSQAGQLASLIQQALGQPSAADLGNALVRNLAGQTTLRQLCAVLKLCSLLLTNDSGPMHVAAAVDTRVVTPFGSTCPELTGPGLPGSPNHALLKSNAPCAPCFLRQCPIDFRCMLSIPTQTVVEAALRLLEPSAD